jgi:hypothetical protein
MTTSICTVAVKALSIVRKDSLVHSIPKKEERVCPKDSFVHCTATEEGEAISGIKFIAQTRVRDRSKYRPATFS